MNRSSPSRKGASRWDSRQGWAALVLELEAELALRLSDALIAAGAAAVDCDAAPAASGSGHRLKLTVLCEGRERADELARTVCAEAGIVTPRYHIRALHPQDWVKRSRAHFAPIRVTPRLWIVPSWHRPPDPKAVNVVLDPGLAFGTGAHPSTRLCLRWLARRVRGGQTVLDYGCGSGILAITAMKLGARRAVGIDIDPAAISAARANARRNRVRVEFRDHGPEPGFAADLVVANILANPLKLLAPLLAARCRPGGEIALSGILPEQASEVKACYIPFFDFDRPLGLGQWVCLSGRRR